MFSVDTTYYCASCKRVQVQDWQFSFDEGGLALNKYLNVRDTHFYRENILTAYTSISWLVEDDEQVCPQPHTLLYSQKTIDTQVVGHDSVVCTDEEIGYVYDEMWRQFGYEEAA